MATLPLAAIGLPTRLLLVEDDPSDLRLISQMAVDAGLAAGQVRGASSLAAARRVLTEEACECILVDLDLPDATGLEAVAVLAAAAPGAALVVLVAAPGGTLAQAAMAEGADEYLVRTGLDPAHLREVLVRAARRATARRAGMRKALSASIVLDAIEAPTVALDGSGRIFAVNRAWSAVGAEAGIPDSTVGVGANYLAACDRAVGPDSECAAAVAAGIRSVLHGEADRFATDYPCNTAAGEGWFSVRVTPIGELGGGAVVTHLDITHLKQVEQLLRTKEALLASVCEETAPIFGLWDADGTMRQVSEAAARLLGLPANQLPARGFMSWVDPTERSRVAAVAERVSVTPGRSERLQLRVVDEAGCDHELDLVVHNRVDDPGVGAIVVSGSEITGGQVDQLARRLESRLLRYLPAAVTVADDQGAVVYWNDRAADLFGYPSEQVVGRRIAELGIAADGSQASAIMSSVAGTGRWEGDFDARHAEGRIVPVHMTIERIDDEEIGFHGIVSASVDIRERRQLEEHLAFQALHDPVTGLPNRRLFVQHLEKCLARTDRTGRRIAVLFIDLDDFKLVNDRIGFAAGDRLLHRVGEQIGSVLRAGDLVARLGGDEFVVCCDDLHSVDESYLVARRILAALGDAFGVGAEAAATRASASVGIALSGPGSSPEGLLRNADMAMYAAKQTSKARIEVFDDALHARVRTRKELAVELEKALDLGQIETYFQPLVALSSGALVGFEALARWPHPERGMVPPTDFIPAAEESGLIAELGLQVLTDSCRALRSWLDVSPDRPMSVAVNVSGRQLSDPRFPESVRRVLEVAGVPPGRVCLEVTETSLVDADVAAGALWELKGLGVDIAIDDFGTGYSSLSRLHQFPLDFLKVDRTFVSGMSYRTEDAVIVSCVLALARGLGVSTIAEGIEETFQLDELESSGCEYGQGWLWSPAVPGDEAIALVRADDPFGTAGRCPGR
jgi:diguanylate cyclase (GGDEF)-like protein/PAS domain S-box-containing protein